MVGSRKGILSALGLAVLASVPVFLARAQEKPAEPPPPAVRRPAPGRPPVEIVVGTADGTATPTVSGCSGHAGGGNIYVTRIDPTMVVVTMTGLAVAKGDSIFHGSSAGYQFNHSQWFEVVFNSPDVKSAKLSLEALALGRLRTHCECQKCGKGAATAQITTPGSATLLNESTEVVSVHLPSREACCCDSETVHNREGPASASITAGKYTLHSTFGFAASAPSSFLNRFAAADFSPEWVLDLRQFGFPEPFLAYGNKDFGFTITLRVVPE